MDPPSRYFVKTLSFFVGDEKRAEKLKEFASKTAVRIFWLCFLFLSNGLLMNLLFFLGGEIRILQVLCEREADDFRSDA